MKILIGLSGGLDSCYAAHCLIAQGHEVVGAAVIMHEYTDISGARKVAQALNIPFITLDERRAFEETVVNNFLAEYTAARTPNPCVICNPRVKFEALCRHAENFGFDKVATGHYAHIVKENDRYFIRRGEDRSKDQSYVLWGLTQKQLSMLYLPLSGMKKSDIRQSAEKLGLPSASAPDSQEICFIPDNDYVSFIKQKTGKTFPSGDFIDNNGAVLGKHSGIINYTVGQRKGLGIALGRPMFVSSINAESNTVTLVTSGQEMSEGADIAELNFMKLCEQSEGTLRANVKVRYSYSESPCTVLFEGKKAKVTFDKPIRAVTPGQSAVFYDGDDILFGGIIC